MEKALTLTQPAEHAPGPQAAPLPPAPPSREPGPDDLFDWPLLRDWSVFVLRAPRRHPTLATATVLTILALAVLSLWALPKTYHVESKILTQKNQVMTGLANPNRAIPSEADAPTRAASDTVLRRENLVALINQTDLVENWQRSRAPALRLKDAVLRVFTGPLSDEEKVDALVGLLEKKLTVTTGEGTVTIGIDWPEAEMAYHLVEAAQQNFLETRHAMEVSIIAEAISILEGHAQTAHDAVLVAYEGVKKAKEGRPTRESPSARPASVARPQGESQELAQIKVMVLAKRRALADLEQFRQKRLTELQTQMAELRAMYAPGHPAVASVKQSIDSLMRESPQIATLRKEEQDLLAEYARRGGRNPDDIPQAPAPLPERAVVINNSAPEDDSMSYPREQLKVGIRKYYDLADRIEAARIELETARAAFKYRYSIVRPAQVPKKPEKPNKPLTVIGGLLAGLVLAFIVPSLLDLYRRTVAEPWQIGRQLGLPLLVVTRRAPGGKAPPAKPAP
ncbi:MAG TPA: hypothetical protein VMT17_18750 [Anaeromyxobacteraceae bacterium]|nr:hypothetical protein [Anaeromyxobacteraceae bacterium]